jgi:pimeloyl-ACP methyl ester carboxylesterase
VHSYRLGGNSIWRLQGTISISSDSPDIQSGTRPATESDLGPLPSLPEGSLPTCLLRTPNGWIPQSASGSSEISGYSDVVSSSLSADGVFTIHREIEGELPSACDGFSNCSTSYSGRLDVDLNTGAGLYSFTQFVNGNVDQSSFSGEANINIEYAYTIVEDSSSACATTSLFTSLLPENLVDLTDLLTYYAPARAIAADSSAQVGLVFETPGKDQPVTLRVVAASVGGSTESQAAIKLSGHDGTESSGDGEVTLTLTPITADGRYYVIAVLRAPGVFPNLKNGSGLQISAELAGAAVATAHLELLAPPLVAIHGIWSDGTAWLKLLNDLRAHQYPAVSMTPVNYGDIGSRAYYDPAVQLRLSTAVRNALESCRAGGTACASVDIVAHSMGGLVTRYFMERQPLFAKVRLLVTVGTPHLGSPLADALIRYGTNTTKTACVATISALVGAGCGISTATCDPAISAKAPLMTLNDTLKLTGRDPTGGGAVSLATTEVSKQLSLGDALYDAVHGTAPAVTNIERVFDLLFRCYGQDETVDTVLGPGHDDLVPASSQIAGARFKADVSGVTHSDDPTYNLSSITSGQPAIRIPGETSNPDVFALVRQFLLNNEPFGPPDAGAPSISGKARSAVSAAEATPRAAPGLIDLTGYTEISASAIRVTLPSATSVIYGRDTEIRFDSPAKRVQKVYLIDQSLFGYQELTGPPFSATISPQRLGAAPFAAIVLFDDKTYAKGPFSAQVQPPAPVFDVQPLADLIRISDSGESYPVQGQALFAGGAAPMSTDELRLVNASDPVLSIQPGGILKASRPGFTSVLARWGSIARRIPVRVGNCGVALDPPAIAGAAGGTGTFHLQADTGCAWSLETDTSWFGVRPATGVGPADVTVSVATNLTRSPRAARLYIGAAFFNIWQAPAGCTYSAASNLQTIPAAGGTVLFQMTAPAGCPWFVRAGTYWLAPATLGVNNGTGQLALAISPNSGPARTGSILVGTQVFSIGQAAGGTAAVRTRVKPRSVGGVVTTTGEPAH